MPVELSDLLSDERWVEVEIGSVAIHIAYRPGATSLRRQAEIQKQLRLAQAQADNDEVEQVERMGEIFCEMVCGWDLTEQGKPLPLTPQIVTQRLPGPVFNAILTAIGEDGRAEADEKKRLSATSDAGLPARGRPATVPNGTSTSEPRATWASRPGR